MLLKKIRSNEVNANNTTKRLRFCKNAAIEACGFARGIWLMGNRDDLLIILVQENQHFLHVNDSDGNNQSWLLTMAYSAIEMERRETW